MRGAIALVGAVTLSTTACDAGYRQYAVTVRDPSALDVQARVGPSEGQRTSLGEADITGEKVVPFRRVPYRYGMVKQGGEVRLQYEDSEGGRRSGLLMDASRTLRFGDARSLGGDWNFTGLYAGTPIRREGSLDIPAWHVVYGEQDAGHSLVALDLVVRTRLENVERVVETTHRPRALGIFALVVSSLIAGGGGYLLATGPSRGFRYGVGLPLLATGLAGGTFGIVFLTRPAQTDRDITARFQ